MDRRSNLRIQELSETENVFNTDVRSGATTYQLQNEYDIANFNQ